MIAEVLIEAIGTVVEVAIDMLPDGKSKANGTTSGGPKPVPRNEMEQRPPTGPYEER
ncbi:hypothetical protein [Sphingomonas sp. 2R-10]|uniref:hypothetical protein n=1 Tax=Sphingomonas sp. 2R-10 TaxID=3045148 RepID=UPI0024BA7EE9|nr:hypothetical protein [Sphingomonas sp. 2R-10]